MFGRTKLSHSFAQDLKRELLGQCAIIEHPEGRPVIHFGPDFQITVGSQWRLIDGHRIVVTGNDDGQWFGLPVPVDAAAKANELLAGRVMKSLDFDPITGDLHFGFAGGLRLDILTNSGGYESWVMFLRGEHFAMGASGGLV